jgi:hypothetical protein
MEDVSAFRRERLLFMFLFLTLSAVSLLFVSFNRRMNAPSPDPHTDLS